MFKLSEAGVIVVAEDSRTTVADFDTAFASNLRLVADTVDSLKGAGVPIAQTQRVYRTFNEGFGHLLKSRSTLVSAFSQLQVIHKHSNQAEVDAGCPRIVEFFISGQAAEEIGGAAVEDQPA